MTDRIVRQLVPKSDDADQRKLFSAFSNQPNLVLLGGPGAGKTHLFTEAAAKVGKRVTTRDFLKRQSSRPAGIDSELRARVIRHRFTEAAPRRR